MSRRSKKPLDWVDFNEMMDGLQLVGRYAIDGPVLQVITSHGRKQSNLSSASFAKTSALMLAAELAKGQ